jgi:hypothetical protein
MVSLYLLLPWRPATSIYLKMEERWVLINNMCVVPTQRCVREVASLGVVNNIFTPILLTFNSGIIDLSHQFHV